MEDSVEKPKVSIIIPTYNSGGTLEECLESVHSQTYPFFEVIIIDNFSSDNTLRIANEFGAKIIQQRCNPAFARNIGIVNSTGKYILFLDSDQVLSPQVVKESVEKCEGEKAGMARMPEVFIGKVFWSFCSAVWKNCYEEVERLYGVSKNIIHGVPRFFMREQIISVGMFDTSLLWGEDYSLYERLRKINAKETLCESKILHHEPASLQKILIRNVRYAGSMPVFLRQTKKQIFPLMFKHAFLTFREVFRSYEKSPAVIVGCAFLLCLKTCATSVGFLMGLFSRT